MITYVVDDAGAARRLGDDMHAIIRDGTQHTYPSKLVVFGDITVAVHSYLDVYISDEEAFEMAHDFLVEIGHVRPVSP